MTQHSNLSLSQHYSSFTQGILKLKEPNWVNCKVNGIVGNCDCIHWASLSSSLSCSCISTFPPFHSHSQTSPFLGPIHPESHLVPDHSWHFPPFPPLWSNSGWTSIGIHWRWVGGNPMIPSQLGSDSDWEALHLLHRPPFPIPIQWHLSPSSRKPDASSSGLPLPRYASSSSAIVSDSNGGAIPGGLGADSAHPSSFSPSLAVLVSWTSPAPVPFRFVPDPSSPDVSAWSLS